MSNKKVITVFGSEKPRDTVKLKKLLTAAVILLAATALILLTVFLVRYFGTQHFVTEDGGGTLVNRRTGITYTVLVPCPYMVNVDFGEVYGEADGVKVYKILYKDNDGEEKFYNPEKMVATVDEFNNVDLYLADGYTLPALNELTPTHGRIYYVEVEEVAVGTLTKDATETVINAVKNGENAVYPSDVAEDSRLNLYLIDPSYPYFWYTIEYFETDSGDLYLRDKALGKCVKATEQIYSIFKSESEEH